MSTCTTSTGHCPTVNVLRENRNKPIPEAMDEKKIVFSDIVVICTGKLLESTKELGVLVGELSMFIVHKDGRKKCIVHVLSRNKIRGVLSWKIIGI